MIGQRKGGGARVVEIGYTALYAGQRSENQDRIRHFSGCFPKDRNIGIRLLLYCHLVIVSIVFLNLIG